MIPFIAGRLPAIFSLYLQPFLSFRDAFVS